MKKLNHKQKAWIAKVGNDYAQKMRRNLFLIFVTCFTMVSFGMYASNDIDFENATGGVATATVMAAIGSIDQTTNEERSGGQVRSKLYLLSADQWDDTQAFPAMVSRQRGNIPLKSGEYWHYIDSVLDSPEPKWSGEEGDVTVNINNELTFIVGGMPDAVFDLLEQGAGKGFFVVWEICSSGKKYIGGTGCKPLKLSNFEGGSTKDNTSTTITFKNTCPQLWCEYVGNTDLEPPSVVAADETTIALTSKSAYELTSGTSAEANITGFTGVTDTDVGRVVTLIGTDGSYPAQISAGGDFYLNDGTTWEASSGAQIDFEIFKDGAGSYIYFEVAGSRTS